MTAITEPALIEPAGEAVRPSNRSGFDRGFRIASHSCAILVLLVLVGIIGSMIHGGWPVFQEFGFFGFLTSSTWDVNNDQYGA